MANEVSSKLSQGLYDAIYEQVNDSLGGAEQIFLPRFSVPVGSLPFNPANCTPVIDYVTVDSGSGPQPINELPVGSSGTIAVYGACLAGSAQAPTQVSISFDPGGDSAGDSTGVAVGTVTPQGWGGVTAHYSVAAGTSPETVVLTVTNGSGVSATTNLDVVTSGPYVSGMIPDSWPAGATTTVTVTGSGFGSNQGSLTVAASNAGDAWLVYFRSWADNQIVFDVSTVAGSGGETVTVTVSGGTNNNLATGFQNKPVQGRGPVNAVADIVANRCYDARDQLIDEYRRYGSPLQPNCNTFQQIEWVAPGRAAMKHLTIGLPSNLSEIPVSDMNWSDYEKWAIVQPSLTGYPLFAVYANSPYPFSINSVYRNPDKEGSGTSRHVFGDAVDADTHSKDVDWASMLNAVHSALSNWVGNGGFYCIEPRQKSSNNHLHIDFEPGPQCQYVGWIQGTP